MVVKVGLSSSPSSILRLVLNVVILGAWYFLSHYPDRVIGGVPASAYVKIEDYVPYGLSVGHHYRDPALTGVSPSHS